MSEELSIMVWDVILYTEDEQGNQKKYRPKRKFDYSIMAESVEMEDLEPVEDVKTDTITIDVVGYHPNNKNGDVDESQMVYDFEEMAQDFEDKLSELDDTAVVMCSVETREAIN